MEIKGKVALVTGGAVRVGKALSLGVAELGAVVALHYNSSQNEAHETVAQIEALGSSAFAIQGDFSRVEQVERVVDACLDKFGRIDILINSAARYQKTPVGQTTAKEWDDLINVNLRAPFFCTQIVAQIMREQKAGKIVNIADVAGNSPWPDYIPYGASKAGLIALTKGFAKLLAPHVQVNAIASGTVLFQEATPEQHRAEIIEGTLLKRVGEPRDIVNTVIFLLRDGDFITGQTIAVDGGSQLR